MAADAEEKLFELVVTTVPTPLVVLDANLRITLANSSFSGAFAYPDRDARGRLLGELHPQWRDPRVNAAIEETLARDEVVEGAELLLETTGGPRVFTLNARWLGSTSREELILVALHDVTDREARLNAATTLSEELERLVAVRTSDLALANAELESFSYSVSHDLRAPLRALDGFSRILLEDFRDELPPEAQRYLDLIQDNSGQMTALIDGLLAFSRLGRLGIDRRVVDVADVVNGVVFLLRAEEPEWNVAMQIQRLGEATADLVLLKQVFLNLLGNALKYSRHRDPARIEVGSGSDRGERFWYVRDNGVGFDSAYSEKAFGMFQRLHRAEDFEGTGIGLALVQRIVARHGGRLWAESTPGEGATFFFTLGSGDA